MENRLFCAEMTGQGELRHGVLKKNGSFFFLQSVFRAFSVNTIG